MQFWYQTRLYNLDEGEDMHNNRDRHLNTPIDSQLDQLQHPQDAHDYYNRGLLRDRSGDREGAFADYNSTIELDPTHAKAYVNRGLIRDRWGDRQGALTDYNRAIELDNTNTTSYYNRGNVRYRLSDLQGALSDYNLSLRINSTYAKAYYNRGLVRADLSDRQGAKKDLRTAADLFREQDQDWDYQNTLEKMHAM